MPVPLLGVGGEGGWGGSGAHLIPESKGVVVTVIGRRRGSVGLGPAKSSVVVSASVVAGACVVDIIFGGGVVVVIIVITGARVVVAVGV